MVHVLRQVKQLRAAMLTALSITLPKLTLDTNQNPCKGQILIRAWQVPR